MRDEEEWRRVWAAMTDEELEARLFTYYWLAMNTPNSHGSRLCQLADEDGQENWIRLASKSSPAGGCVTCLIRMAPAAVWQHGTAPRVTWLKQEAN